jgi:hypothetical protein
VRLEVAILHNGVIDPGVFTEKDYNRPLCYLALEYVILRYNNNNNISKKFNDILLSVKLEVRTRREPVTFWL